jgi:isopentenyl diphosphate isomerase/L-lactate dehydrogenase-like FMN-dependent dehydrogenase
MRCADIDQQKNGDHEFHLMPQRIPGIMREPRGRIAPLAELVNTLELADMAERRIGPAAFADIADGEPSPFERFTFRPRLMVNTSALDLMAHVLGQELYAPIVIGPVARQKRFHPEGELAMARGASAAKALMVIPDQTSVPLEEIAPEAKAGFWYQVSGEGDAAAARSRAQHAIGLGAKAVCVTPVKWDWNTFDSFRKGLNAPVVLKGVLSAGEARVAAERGVQGMVVSSYSRDAGGAVARSIDLLPAIAEAVAGKAAIFIDGGFRRGAHILMALALGAQAVLIARPAAWGLAAYGAEGVTRAFEMLQTELGRDMAMCGRPNLKSIDRSVVRIHRS